MDAKKTSYFVVVAAWLAVFCLFGYRSTFAILAGPMSQTMGWTGAQVSLGYSLMMSIYAITAFFSGMILDKWGTKPVYTIAAVFCMLGFYLTIPLSVILSPSHKINILPAAKIMVEVTMNRVQSNEAFKEGPACILRLSK